MRYLRLRAQITVLVIVILIINAMTLISAAPSIITHPVGHFFFIVLGVANLAAIGWFEYMVNYDWRKKM